MKGEVSIMKRIVLCSAVVVVLVAATLVFGQGPSADGKSVYTAQKCQLCHSIAGQGNKKSPLDGVGKKLGADQIRKWIVNPKGMKADTKMKAYPSPSAKELDALVAYLSSLK
jgi:cytochrome c2